MREMVKSYISFYFHQYRVHIFMDVLRGMGNPSRICFMVDFSGNRLLIVPYEKLSETERQKDDYAWEILGTLAEQPQ